MARRNVSPTPSSALSLEAYLQQHEHRTHFFTDPLDHPQSFDDHGVYSNRTNSWSPASLRFPRGTRSAQADASSPRGHGQRSYSSPPRTQRVFQDVRIVNSGISQVQAARVVHFQPTRVSASYTGWRDGRASTARHTAEQPPQSTPTSDQWQALKDKYSSSLPSDQPTTFRAQPSSAHGHLPSSGDVHDRSAPHTAAIAGRAYLARQPVAQTTGPSTQVSGLLHSASHVAAYKTHPQTRHDPTSSALTPRDTPPAQSLISPRAHKADDVLQVRSRPLPHQQSQQRGNHILHHNGLISPVPTMQTDLVSTLWQQAPCHNSHTPHTVQLQSAPHAAPTRAALQTVSVATQTVPELHDTSAANRGSGPAQLADLLRQLAELVSQLQSVQVHTPSSLPVEVHASSTMPATQPDRRALLEQQQPSAHAPDNHRSLHSALKDIVEGLDNPQKENFNEISSIIPHNPMRGTHQLKGHRTHSASRKPAHVSSTADALHPWPGLPDSLVTSLQSYLRDKVSRQRKDHTRRQHQVRGNLLYQAANSILFLAMRFSFSKISQINRAWNPIGPIFTKEPSSTRLG